MLIREHYKAFKKNEDLIISKLSLEREYYFFCHHPNLLIFNHYQTTKLKKSQF